MLRPIVLAAAALLVFSAAADGKKGEYAKAEADPFAEVRAAAKKDFQEGIKLFREQRRYRDALAKFLSVLESIQTDRVPILEGRDRVIADLLYDIAMCHDYLAEWDPAVKRYREWLDTNPAAEDRVKVEVRIREIEQSLSTGTAKERDKSSDAVLDMPASFGEDLPVETPIYKKPALWAAVVAAVVVIGAVVGIAVAASTPKNAAFPTSDLGMVHF